MKFILKEGLIHIVGNHGLPNNSIEGTVEAPGLNGFEMQYSVNNGKYQPLKNKIVLTKEDLQNTSIKLKVRAINGKEILQFESDTVPITHTILFGETMEDKYPEVIKVLLKRMKEVEELLGIKEEKIEKNMEETKQVLHKHMLELVDTFEEINKKGSLF